MLDAEKRRSLTDMMQNHFTDLDLERDEPFRFKSGDYVLIIDCVPFLYHDKFLMDMFELITMYGEIFYNIDFLTAHNLNDKNEVNKLMDQVAVFQANKTYSKFIKDSISFVCRWGHVAKVKKDVVKWVKRKPKIARKVIEVMQADVFIYVLFLVFVRNYDVVKKNTLQFLKIFQPVTNQPTETSSPVYQKLLAGMKFPESASPEWYLELLAQRNKTQ